jgi:WD40 repeat protein
MSKRLTYEFVKEQFEKEGYKLLSKEYINSWTKLKYICPKGHEHSIKWSDWQQERRCPYCAGQGRPTIEFIRSEFAKEGYELLVTKYKNAHQKLSYICDKGHKHSITWTNWCSGQRCPYCAGVAKKTIEFIEYEFEKDNYVLLTKQYINCDQKLDYICPEGHRHSVSWSNWGQGQRCPYCVGNAKLNIEFIRSEFTKENYQLLTTEYINSKQKLEYICFNGHKHSISWSDWQTGNRCPYCAGLIKKDIKFVRSEFAKENYKLLNKEYTNACQKLNYICPKGHRHDINWLNWSSGKRCPYCSGKAKKTIKFIRSEFEKENYILLSTEYKNIFSYLLNIKTIVKS